MKFKKFKLKSGAKLVTIMSLITALTTMCSMPAFAMKSLRYYKLKERHSSLAKENFLKSWKCIFSGYDNYWRIYTENKKKTEIDQIAKLISDCEPLQENFILSENSITNTPIEWNYFQVPAEQINTRNLYDIFHGIVSYITYYSDNKFNASELKFFCTGSYKYVDPSWLKNPKYNNNLAGNFKYDVLNILPVDYKNVNNYLTVDPDYQNKNTVVGYWFNRIKVNPIGYALRFKNLRAANDASPASMCFFGIDENRNKVVLDERKNINDLIPNGGCALFFCRTTDKQFKAFAVEMYDPSNTNYKAASYNIVAFEIHGNIFPDSGVFEPNQADLEKEDTNSFGFDINPCMDMSDFMF